MQVSIALNAHHKNFTKHISLRFHHRQTLVVTQIVSLHHVRTECQIAKKLKIISDSKSLYGLIAKFYSSNNRVKTDCLWTARTGYQSCIELSLFEGLCWTVINKANIFSKFDQKVTVHTLLNLLFMLSQSKVPSETGNRVNVVLCFIAYLCLKSENFSESKQVKNEWCFDCYKRCCCQNVSIFFALQCKSRCSSQLPYTLQTRCALAAFIYYSK